MFDLTKLCILISVVIFMVSTTVSTSTLADTDGNNKRTPLTLHYMFAYAAADSIKARSYARGALALRDIIVDLVNQNQSVLPHYHVSINAIGSFYELDSNIGSTIQLFLNEVVGTSNQQYSSCAAQRFPGSSEVIKASSFRPVPLYFGPQISAEAVVIGQLAPKYNLVGISSTAVSSELSDRNRFPNFFRTSLNSESYHHTPRALMTYFNYSTVALVHSSTAIGADMMQAVDTDLRAHNIQVLYKQAFPLMRGISTQDESIRAFSANIRLYDARILVFFTTDYDAHIMFCTAINTIGTDVFTANKYLFVFLMWVEGHSRIINPEPIVVPGCSKNMLARLFNGSFIAMYPSWDPTPDRLDLGMATAKLREKMLNLSRSAKYGNNESISMESISNLHANTADMFWTGLLALDALDKRLQAERPAPRTLRDFTFESADITAMLKEEIIKVKFRGATGDIAFSASGRFNFSIPITQYIPDVGCPKRFVFEPESGKLTLISTPTFATVDGRPPLDKNPPIDAAAARIQLISIICIAVGLVLCFCLVAAIVVYMYQKRRLAKSLANPPWLVHSSQLQMRSLADSQSSLAGGSIYTNVSAGLTILSIEDWPVYPTALLNEGEMIVKLQLISSKAPRLQVNEANHKIMTAFQENLTHVNVVRFIGYCVYDGSKTKKLTQIGTGLAGEQYLIREHCEKGSLQEMIENSSFKLDATLEYALLLDVAHGMAFLHHYKSASTIGRCHGNLNTDSCLIDKRFSVKVDGYGDKVLAALFGLDKLSDDNLDEAEALKKQLYWAPELPGQTSVAATGSQASDVYAYSMTMYAVVTRLHPFEADLNFAVSPEQLLEAIRNSNSTSASPTRPTVSAATLGIHFETPLAELMQRCWAEQPSKRPSFADIVKQLRLISHTKGGQNSITDQLLSRLERYASDMESLVAERTRDLVHEKRRSDDLLHRMLPPEIVSELKRNGQVQPESFDSVTIYFSDIVGFTVISSSSTPIEIVNMLNALYTMFDAKIDLFDAYKVETIGDAYMVVSGLPRRNGDRHAAEIARLSLALLDGIQTFAIPHRPTESLLLRIGLHTGPCVAGVVGNKMPRYCLFGDTVNTASRMESNGAALKIHISHSTKQALDAFEGFATESRGILNIKGKGTMETYWLTGMDAESAL